MRKLRTFTKLAEFLENLPIRKNKKVREARNFWVKFLKEEPSSQKEWNLADKLANDWQLCACGTSLPRELRCKNSINGGPVDIELGDLGYRFMFAIEGRDYSQARRAFLDIQRRKAELLQELNIKTPTFN